ncbi:hypothetical protein [Streptomyces sp. GbtcB6]|uniref:hypothetical protein n=1 Tax=Streptomyces sp. GbtcB6 TaxID=2824751 RepID=UPI001C30B0A8|nr:hypothetical protein [Streptomyces sp. GbtcB6]
MSSVPDELHRSQLAIKAPLFVLGFQYATWDSGHSLQSRERVRPARTGQPQQHS